TARPRCRTAQRGQGHPITEQHSGHHTKPTGTPRHDNDLRICTLNARTVASECSQSTLEHSLSGIRYDVICLQETKSRTLTERTFDDGAKLILGPKVEGKNIGGIGFIIHPRLTSSIISFSVISPRLGVLRLRIGRSSSIAILTVYAPTSNATIEERQAFFNEVASVYEGEKKHFYRVIAGDLNVRVGPRRDGAFRTGPFHTDPQGDPDDLLFDLLSSTRSFHGNSLSFVAREIKEHRSTVLLRAAEARRSLKKAKQELSKGRSPMEAVLDSDGTAITSRAGIEERGPDIALHGETLVETDAYVYLGRELRGDGSIDTELKRRKRAAWAAYGSIREVTSMLKDAKLRSALFDSHVLPALCYAAESWPLSNSVISYMQTTHRALERSLIGTNLYTMHQKKRSSSDVRRQSLLTDPIRYIKRAKHRWAGHVLRRDDGRWSTTVTEWFAPDLRRPPGKPPVRWRDSIVEYAKMPYSVQGRITRSSSQRQPYRHWTTRARDREEWRNCDPHGNGR
ncbi:hypothetical protein PFISCL1PPCAC_1069, partial [Pristionchus fissidentatus]